MRYKRDWVPYHAENEKTERQWNLSGYEVKPWFKKKGEERWTGHQVAIYFSDKQVRPSDTIIEKTKAKERRKAKARKKRLELERKATERRRAAITKKWTDLLVKSKKVLVFDTETTGLIASYDYILSLSWQVLDEHLHTLEKQTRYFNNPLPEKVCYEAIEVNGLTNERLLQLGTTNKHEGLVDFINAYKDCGMIVAHNASFDCSFIHNECIRENIDNSLYKSHPVILFDTMTEMTYYCAIPSGYYDYKWPRLDELASSLGINTEDIDWHQSSSDVEVTVRCLREIIERGLALPPSLEENCPL